jgi:predicted NBD/HSP70 family sugar kinase
VRKINTNAFRRATRSTSRDINRRIALNLVREHQPISRADLARRMHVGRGVVTALVNELLDEGAVFEGASGHLPRGRRPRLLFVRTRDRLVCAVDVRLSRTYLMLGDFAGTEIALESFATPRDPGALVDDLVHRIRRLLDAHAPDGRCEGIGVVVPGLVEQPTGRVLVAPQLGWRDVEIREPLAARLGLPVHVENAPLACALAQMWLGDRADVGDHFVYVTVSDGVGAGIVVDGRIVRGHTNNAGEFGHIPVESDGALCLCGRTGCLEAYTSNLATLSRYLGRPLTQEGTRELLESVPLTVQDVIARARAGEPRALEAVEATGRWLGRGLAAIVNALNPAQIVVGGEITAAWELIEPALRAAVAERALTPAAALTPIVADRAAYPRLRGATALVAAPSFAAPEVA